MTADTRWQAGAVLGPGFRAGRCGPRYRRDPGRGSARLSRGEGGFVVPHYLGSKATFTLGQFGGHVGRALRTGDVLRLAAPES